MGGQSPGDTDEASITITKSDGWFVVHDQVTGVTTQGETRSEALENLADAIPLHEDDPEEDVEPEPADAPWF